MKCIKTIYLCSSGLQGFRNLRIIYKIPFCIICDQGQTFIKFCVNNVSSSKSEYYVCSWNSTKTQLGSSCILEVVPEELWIWLVQTEEVGVNLNYLNIAWLELLKILNSICRYLWNSGLWP